MQRKTFPAMDARQISDRLQRDLPRLRERLNEMAATLENERALGATEHQAVSGGVEALLNDPGWSREELSFLTAVAVSMLPRIELIEEGP